jgi:succinoglycan biosynthesis protein ExoA
VSERARLPSLPDRPRVSVVIPALRAAEVIGRAVASALEQRGVDEVVVAAGDSATRDAATAASGDPRLRVVDNPGGRTPDALNTAIAASTGEVLVRLDAHAKLPEGYVARAVDTLRRSGAANVGGRQVPEAERGFARAVAIAMASPAGAGNATYRVGGEEGPTDTVYLGVFRRQALDRVGGFDPRFTRNQDAELNLRLRRAGYQVWFDPDLAVSYRPRGTVGSLARQYLQYGRWRRLTARIHPRSLTFRQLAAPALVLGLAAAALLSAWLGTWLVFGTSLALYGALLVVAVVVARPEPRYLLATVVALASMHLSWGVGFLIGPPRAVHAEPTRSACGDG